jgi:uncharacterized cupredoxin-like copper-binding protein
MKKTHLIVILIGFTITLSMLPAANAVGITFVSPTGETYERGDTLVIEAISYALDADAFLQIKRSSTVVWVDQVVGGFSANFVYTMVIPSDWSGGTYTIHVKGDTGSTGSTTFYLSVPSAGGGGYTPPAFTLSDFSVSPSTVNPNEPVTVSVKVTNPGVISNSATLKLKIDGVIEASKEVILPAGESETVSWTVKKGELGTYEVNVNGKTGSFTVVAEEGEEEEEEEEPSPADFILIDLIVDPQTVEPGEEVTVSVTVKNVGGKSGSYTAELLIDGFKVDEETVTLDPGEETTVEFTVTEDTDGTYTVSIGLLSDSFTVETPPPPPTPAEFELSNLVISPTTVEIGEPISVSVTVTNIGEEAGSYTAELLIDASKVDEDTVSLVGGASETVEFTGVSGEEGSHTVSVGDLSGSFTVVMPPEGEGFNPIFYAVGGLAILGVAWVVYKQFLES